MDSQTTSEEPEPAISVVLPVLNEAKDIRRLLEEVLGQVPPAGGFEVLVADGGSTDGTQEIVGSIAVASPRVRLIENVRRLSSAGRNVGAAAARGRYVMFLDGHCALPRSDYLLRAVELFESTGASCLARPQPLDRLTDGNWAEAISRARHSWFGHASGSDIYGGEPGFTDPRSAGAAYLRSCLQDLGGYDERFDACEDVEFNHRVAVAGLLAYRHPDLAVHYRPRSTLRGLFRQMMRYGRGRARLMGRHPSMVPWPLVAITVYAIATVALGVTGRLEAVAWVGGLPAALWLVLAAFEGLRAVGARPMALRMVAAFGTVYAGLMLGFWRGLVEIPRYRSPGRRAL